QAIAAYRKSIELGNDYSAPLGYAYGRSGKTREAQKIIERLERSPHPSPISMAIVYAGLGKKDQSLALLEGAYKDRSDSFLYIKSQILFDPLRSEPRFQALVRRMAFPP